MCDLYGKLFMSDRTLKKTCTGQSSELVKDATKHETKAGVEISQGKMINRPCLNQFPKFLCGIWGVFFSPNLLGCGDFNFLHGYLIL